MSRSVVVIAEAGVNHNGDLTQALALVDEAARAGADYVKFQTFQASEIAAKSAGLADYQSKSVQPQTQVEMLAQLQLSESDHRALMQRCQEKKIQFLSTPFDLPSLDLLQRLGLKTLKVGSGDITNLPFLIECARKSERMIVSTGMANLEEVGEALSAVAWGFSKPDQTPASSAELLGAFTHAQLQEILSAKITLLHCTTEYPCPFDQVNLLAMHTLAQEFGLEVGYSDHTTGIAISVAAAALGARVIEKHFTLDRNLPGPDQKASIEPNELVALVRSVREVERGLGSAVKQSQSSEEGNKKIARKVLVARQNVGSGSSA